MVSPLLATHNRAGEITLTRIDDLTYEITHHHLYLYPESGRRAETWRYSGETTPSPTPIGSTITKLPNFYQKNVYITQHTFPGPGIYEIVVQDPNRNEGVKNIPNSVNVIFSIKTTILINPDFGKQLHHPFY